MWLIIYIDENGVTTHHNFRPSTKEEALTIGYELTRDNVAQFFRIHRLK